MHGRRFTQLISPGRHLPHVWSNEMSKPTLFARPYELALHRCSQVWICDIASRTLELVHENFDVYRVSQRMCRRN